MVAGDTPRSRWPHCTCTWEALVGAISPTTCSTKLQKHTRWQEKSKGRGKGRPPEDTPCQMAPSSAADARARDWREKTQPERKGSQSKNVMDKGDSLKSDKKLGYLFIPLPIFRTFFVVQKLYSHHRPWRPSNLTAQQHWPSHSGILTLSSLTQARSLSDSKPFENPKRWEVSHIVCFSFVLPP